MIITEAKYEDLPAVLALQKLCYQENAERYNDFQIAPLLQTLEELQNEYQHSVILKAEEEGANIIGSIRAYEKDGTCHIGRVIVHPDYRDRGLGSRLMAEIESRFPHVPRFQLFTGFKDEKNLYFYGKLGYRRFKEEKQGDVTLVYLEK